MLPLKIPCCHTGQLRILQVDKLAKLINESVKITTCGKPGLIEGSFSIDSQEFRLTNKFVDNGSGVRFVHFEGGMNRLLP